MFDFKEKQIESVWQQRKVLGSSNAISNIMTNFVIISISVRTVFTIL